MINELFIGKVNQFYGGEPDVNGKNPVIIDVLAGKCPNKRVLSGTVAESIGLTVGKIYLMNVYEIEEDVTYGRQFRFNSLGELSVLDFLEIRDKLGRPVLIDVTNEVLDDLMDDEKHPSASKSKVTNFEKLNR